MDDELRINRIQPYPRKREDGGSRRPADEVPEEEEEGIAGNKDEESEVTDGHIDTRVAPPHWCM